TTRPQHAIANPGEKSRLGRHGSHVVHRARNERFDRVDQHPTDGEQDIGVAGNHRDNAHRQPGRDDDDYRGQKILERGQPDEKTCLPLTGV
ncbi:hypothetical protein ACWDTP_26315, partial [Mycobacterium sp. NPDC003449]